MSRRGRATGRSGWPGTRSVAWTPSPRVMLISPVFVRSRTQVMPGPFDTLRSTGALSRSASHAPSRSELGLIRKLLQFPEIVESATVSLAAHQVPFYLQELATAFSAFYRDCPVLPPRNPDLALTNARLKLVAATKQVLASGLELIGVSAPERMAERAQAVG